MTSSNLAIPGYEIIETLYESSRTTIYRACHSDSGRNVVLKCLTTPHPGSRDILHFRREFEIGTSLEGDEFIEFYDMKRHGRRLVLVEEDFGGESLQHTLEYRRFELEEFLVLAIDIVQALGRLHEQHVVHRDINPSNLVWNPQTGEFKIIDFGLAVQFQQLRLGGPSEETIGTVPYISPEQTRRTNQPIDYRTDYYSLGVTLYELLTGSRPFKGDKPGELIHAHLAQRPLPAHHRRKDVPHPVSSILSKLMSKSAGARYQSASGLIADLERCLEEYRTTGGIPPFELGTQDRRRTLKISRELYGRQSQLEQLASAVEAVRDGGRRLSVIEGPGGIGKSVLVEHLQRGVIGAQGEFVSSKFEEPRNDRPYSAIADAFGRLIGRLARYPKDEFHRWRDDIRDALGDDDALVAAVIPELEMILGGALAGPQLDPEEAHHRFQHAFCRLTKVFCQHYTALVVGLDDLQWADDASLQLLEVLLNNERLQHLAVVVTVRTEDVDDEHPAIKTIERLEEGEQPIERLRLAPLSEDDITGLVADSLGARRNEVEELGRLVHKKTSGNPYFTGQFLKALYRRELLWFDANDGTWQWDAATIAEFPVTENVVDVLKSRLDALPEETCQLLVDASFLGAKFSIDTLAEVSDYSLHEVHQRMIPALEDDIVAARSEFELLDPDDITSPAVIRRLFFPHDRIREAARQIVDSHEHSAIRLRIGRRLQQYLSTNDSDEVLFAAVRNLDAAAEQIDEPEKHRELLELNVRAATRAFDLQAISDAARFLEQAIELVDDTVWTNRPGLARQILLNKTRAELLLGRFDIVEQHLDVARRRIETPVELIDFECLAIRCLTRQARLKKATEVGRRALRSIGYDLPLQQLDEVLPKQLGRVEERFGDRPVQYLTEISGNEDEKAEAALRVLAVLQPAAGLLDLQLLVLVALKSVDLTFDVGIRPESLVGLVMYGNALCLYGRPDRGRRAGELAMQLARQFDQQTLVSHVAFVLAAMVLPWSRPIEESLPLYEEGYQAGVRSGNQLFAGYNRFLRVLYQYYLGEDLREVMRETTKTLQFCRQIHNIAGVDLAMTLQAIVANLLGQTDSYDSFETAHVESFDAHIQRCRDHDTHAAVAIFQIARAQINLLHGHGEKALRQLDEMSEDLGPLVGTVDTARQPFWTAMALADVLPSREGQRRQEGRSRLDKFRDRMHRYAESSPVNFAGKLALIDAETARLDRDLETAIDRYDEAIGHSRQHDRLHLEALANQRAGLFWLEQQKEDFAGLYLRDARDSFDLWQARRLRDETEQNYQSLFVQQSGDVSDSISTSGDIVDIDSVFNASEMIASHLELEHLLPVLMEVTLENAGAKRGTFVSTENGHLQVAVQGETESKPIRYDPPLELDQWEEGARSIIRYVRRTRQPLVLNRAHRDPRFRNDEYLQQRRPCSICCLPAEERGQLRGILYVENDLVENAFGEARTRVLKILAGHIAIALHKASLYGELHEKKERFRQLAENIQEVFWLMEWPDLQISYLSPAFETVWGRPMPELPMSVDDLVETVLENDRENFVETMRQDMPVGSYDETYRIERPSGTQRWINSKAFPITDTDGQVHRIAGIARDVTREQELSQMKDEFISVVSHELRTPLTPITGVFSMLQREYRDELPDDVVRMTELGLRNSRRLLELIDDLLDIQKLSMEQVEFDSEIFDVRELLEEALEINAPLGDTRDIRYELNSTSTPLYVRGDQGRLIQVMTNLLSNAVKFSESGDVVEVTLRQVEDTARISVTDHGPGIPADVRHKIFDKFSQADATLTRKHGGIGLGLAIARALVDRFDGRIYFETELGEGTTFHVELPLAEKPADRDKSPSAGR